jgi:hypothetical protein
VQESGGKAMPFANVLLLNSKDSTLVKGAVSDETGYYIIDKVQSGTYLLAATMVGYKMAYGSAMTVKEQPGEIKAPLLTLSYDTKQLKEVNVISTRPFVEQEIDRTV